jgi:hypothetical protein
MIRCMTAICPAGPPKLSAATRSQTRNASASETPCLVAAAARRDAVSEVAVSEVSVTAALRPAQTAADYDLI